ncbi:hypothetical protein [Photobacterium sanguinicancri]|uniref:hypothetical protein n=1 Tax=Photobacterium sanguinicancri TaxID=875932 RepID=UPI003D0FFE4A
MKVFHFGLNVRLFIIWSIKSIWKVKAIFNSHFKWFPIIITHTQLVDMTLVLLGWGWIFAGINILNTIYAFYCFLFKRGLIVPYVFLILAVILLGGCASKTESKWIYQTRKATQEEVSKAKIECDWDLKLDLAYRQILLSPSAKITPEINSIYKSMRRCMAIQGFISESIIEKNTNTMLAEVTKRNNESCPIIIDEYTKLDRIYSTDKQYIALYTLTGLNFDYIDKYEFFTKIKKALIENVCSNYINIAFMNNGVDFNYIYKDDNQNEVISIIIEKSDCVDESVL